MDNKLKNLLCKIQNNVSVKIFRESEICTQKKPHVPCLHKVDLIFEAWQKVYERYMLKLYIAVFNYEIKKWNISLLYDKWSFNLIFWNLHGYSFTTYFIKHCFYIDIKNHTGILKSNEINSYNWK